MKHPAYPKNKESGVVWLGAVPEHWEVKRGRFAMRVNPSSPILRSLDADFEISFVPMDAVGEYGGVRLEQTRVKAETGNGYTEFQDGDVVVAKITPCFENGKGALVTGLVNGAAYGTTELHVLRAGPHLDERYIFYLTITDGFRKFGEAEMYGAGGQKRVPPEFCKDFPTPLPSSDEQTRIADFLDRETGRIDTLVAKKRALIGLLKEKRSALISRIVTRGLPAEVASEFGLEPHTRFKDSGIEWLGQVPEGWEVKKLGQLSVIVRGGSPRPAGDPRYFDGDYIPWITVGEVTKDTNVFLETTETMLTEEGASCSRTIKSGTLIITNSGATLGVPKILKLTGCANDGIVAFEELSTKADIYFLYYFLSSLTNDLRNRLKQGGGQPNLNTDLIKAISIPFPSKVEQTAIAAYLDRETAKIDRLIEKVEAAIERLREYRTALITAAVTGKIDVRRVPKKEAVA